jgi:threonine dehydratase
MRVVAETLKLVVEPTGCLGFAAARRRAPDLRAKRVGVLISGGNVDLDRYAILLQRH